MSRRNSSRIFAALLLGFGYGVVFSADNHLSIVVEPGKGGAIVYRSENKTLPFRDVYQLASDQLTRSETKPDYYIIFRDDVPFSNVINVLKTLQAIGYLDVRIFVFDKDKRYMTEVAITKMYPYSLDPISGNPPARP